jgi:hypothetical protein
VPDGIEELHALPPGEKPPRVPLPPADSFGVATDYDGPAARVERLAVLTGGAGLHEFFRIRKAVVTKSGSQVSWFADVLFTDAGVLIVPFAQMQSANMVGAGAGGGLLGVAVAAGAAAIAARAASAKYDRLAADDADLPPDLLFIQRKGELLPADELGSLKFARDGSAASIFRGVTYRFAPHKKADPDMMDDWEDAERFAPRWHDDAERERASRRGAPERPGAAALIEWGQRPTKVTPPWAAEVIEAMAAGPSPAATRVLRSAPPKVLGGLSYQLENADAPGAEALQRTVRGVGLGWSMGLFLAAAICLALLIVPIGALALASARKDVTGLSVLAIVALGLTALILGLVGLARFQPFHAGRSQARKAARK